MKITVVLLVLLTTSIYTQNISRHQQDNYFLIEPLTGKYITSASAGKIHQIMYPDTIYSKTNSDSLRFFYNYNIETGTMVEIQQSVNNGLVNNITRYTISKNGDNKISITEIWQNNKWVNSTRIKEEYSGTGDILLFSEEYFNGINWQMNLRFLFTYEDGLRKTFLREYFAEGNPVFRLLETYTYLNDYLSVILLQKFEDSIWMNSARGEWIRDPSGNQHEYFFKIWRNNTWVDSSRVYTFYNNLMQDTLTTIEVFNRNQWTYFLKHFSAYNSDGRRAEQSYYKWTVSWNKWIKFLWEYDAEGQILSEIIQKTNQDTWTNFSRELFSYRFPGKTDFHSLEYWSNKWDNYSMEIIVYDELENIKEFRSSLWDNGIWEEYDKYISITDPEGNLLGYSGSKILFTYKELSFQDDPVPSALFDLQQNFPNPFNNTTKINFHLYKTGFTTLKIFDLLGREIETIIEKELTSGRYSFHWQSRNSLSSGTYFYRLLSSGGTITRKMNLVK